MENTDGLFFRKPFWQSRDGNLLGSAYTKIVSRSPAYDESDYPIFVVIGLDFVSFYVTAHYSQAPRDNKGTIPQQYGLGLIYSFSFATGLENTIVNWLQNQDDFPEEALDITLYERQPNTDDLSFSTLLPWCVPQPEKGVLLSFREMSLDFLFDLLHSNVFSNHPAKSRLEAVLRKEPLVNAIVSKANFYYARAVKEEEHTETKHAETRRQESEYKTKALEKYAADWLKVIRTPDAEKLLAPIFNAKRDWFDDIEQEHRNVFLPIGLSRGKGNRFEFKAPQKEKEESVQWLLERYDLFGAICFQFGKVFSKLENILFVLSLFALMLSLPYIKIKIEISSLQLSTFIQKILVCFVLIGPIIFLSLFVQRILVFALTIINLYNTVLKKIIVSLIIVLCFETLFSYILKRQPTILGVNLYAWLIADLSVLSFLLYTIKSLPADTILSLPKLAQFFKPKMLLGVAAVWSWFLSAGLVNIQTKGENGSKNALINDVLVSDSFWPFIIGLFLLSLGFILSKLTPLLPMRNKRRKAWIAVRRALFLLVTACYFSLFIGIILIGMFPGKFFNQDTTTFISRFTFDKDKTIAIPLTMMFAFSLIAATVGIIFEMGINNKAEKV